MDCIGSINSCIKTHYNYISNIDGSNLLAGTAKCLTYSQLGHAIRLERESHQLKGDMFDNIQFIDNLSVEKNLESLNMPDTPAARIFFGFFH